VLIEPDRQRFMLTWRATVPMRRSCFDIVQVVVGEELRRVRSARRSPSKTHYGNLDEMIKAQRKMRRENEDS